MIMADTWRLARKRSALQTRAHVIQAIREYFISGGYLEVDTPLLIPAPAPEAHIDAVPASAGFLHTSPELCMKRLVAAGYDRIFQICHCWRAGERGRLHHPEFTMLEWYRTGADYLSLMVECEALFRHILGRIAMAETFTCHGREIRLSGTWERLSVREAFQRFAGVSMEESLANDMFDELMVERIEPFLGWDRPVFLHDYPAARAALARIKNDDATVAERFELYICGIELANAFSELTDPLEQRARFVSQIAQRGAAGHPTYPLPDKFLAALAEMPPVAGIALGIDRLVMLLRNASCIDEVVAFPPEEL
jgi:elongation factor P--(R)-beta-lysine ligase